MRNEEAFENWFAGVWGAVPDGGDKEDQALTQAFLSLVRSAWEAAEERLLRRDGRPIEQVIAVDVLLGDADALLVLADYLADRGRLDALVARRVEALKGRYFILRRAVEDILQNCMADGGPPGYLGPAEALHKVAGVARGALLESSGSDDGFLRDQHREGRLLEVLLAIRQESSTSLREPPPGTDAAAYRRRLACIRRMVETVFFGKEDEDGDKKGS